MRALDGKGNEMVNGRTAGVLKALGRTFLGFPKDRRGNVAILAAFSVVPLIATVGVATDSARGYLLNNRLQEAIDIAALAAARGEGDLAARQAIMEQYFWANYPNDYLGATVSGPSLVPLADDQFQVSVSVSMPNTFLQVIDIDTTTISASTVVQKEGRGMELVLVMDNTGSMRGDKMTDMIAAAKELINILYGTEETIEDFWVGLVPYAATVNIGRSHTDWLAGDLDTQHSYFIDPEREYYRPRFSSGDDGYWSNRSYFWPDNDGGYDGDGDAQPADQVDSDYGREKIEDGDNFTNAMYALHDVGELSYLTYASGWKGCVEARWQTGHDRTDEPPILNTLTNTFTPFFYPPNTDNEWCRIGDEDGEYCDTPMTPPGSGLRRLLIQLDQRNEAQNDGLGPNLGCPPAITPLVAARTTIIDAIDEMQPWHRGGTMGNLGLAWGWRTVSPRWRGLWAPDSPAELPLDYDTPLMDKVVIMLTDGENQFYDHPPTGPQGSDYTAYGRRDEGRLTSGDVTAELNDRMAATCQAMKDQGIILYTITFSLSDSTTQDLYRDCATSDDHYFNSPTGDELKANFRTIAGQLSNLRLAQ